MTITSYLVLLTNITEQFLIVRLSKTVCSFKASRIRYLGYFVLILTILPAPLLMNKPDFCPGELLLALQLFYFFGRLAAYSIIFSEISLRVLYIFLQTMSPPQIYMNICMAFIDDYELCNLLSFIIDSVIIACILIYLKSKKMELVVRKVIESLPKKIYINVLLISYIAAVFVMGENKPDHELYYKRYILPSMIGLVIFAFSIIKISISEAEKKTTIDMLSKQVENEVKYYEKINSIYGEFRSFRHDFKNHMICLGSLIEANEKDKALDYIAEIENLSSVEKKQFNTGNIIIDALLNDKNDRAATVNSVILFKGMVPTTGISNVDLCIIMANAIDNAIEACGKDTSDDRKEINIEADFQHGYFFLNIANPIFEAVSIKSNNTIATSKSDKEHHGFGVSNILRTVRKYDGEAEMSADSGKFTLDIQLMLRAEEV